MGEKIPLIARSIGGKVLGPRPGKAIVTFWQGIVEIILRLLVVVLSTAALIPASVALSDQQNLSAELNKDRNVASGLVVGVAVISIVLELVMVALRFANIGYLNYNIRLFLIADSIVSGVLAVFFLAGCAASAYGSNQLHDNVLFKSLAAASAFSFFASLSLACMGVWSFLFMMFKWNKHVITYTLRNAVLG